jgi:hypothetical protein
MVQRRILSAKMLAAELVQSQQAIENQAISHLIREVALLMVG